MQQRKLEVFFGAIAVSSFMPQLTQFLQCRRLLQYGPVDSEISVLISGCGSRYHEDPLDAHLEDILPRAVLLERPDYLASLWTLFDC